MKVEERNRRISEGLRLAWKRRKKETKVIKPTVGRVVWFYKYITGQGHKGPLAAHVACVHSDTMVNVMVINEGGVPRPETSVRLVQDDGEVPQSDYCCWMPYQKAVASGQIAPTLHENQTSGAK